MIVFIFLCFLLCVRGQPYSYIGSYRGAITAVQNTETLYGIKEMTFVENSDAQLWTIEKDPALNGVFIRSKLYPSLVWDIKGGKLQVGTEVILYTKKTTLATTKNQRWFVQPDTKRITSVLDKTFVANVSSTGVVIEKKSFPNILKDFQLLQVVGQNEKYTITFKNNYARSMGLYAMVPLIGRIDYNDVVAGATSQVTLWAGSELRFKVSTGPYFYDNVYPYPVVVSKDASYQFPVPKTTPAGTAIWNDPMVGNMLLTFKKNGRLSGRGNDKWGNFVSLGEYDADQGTFTLTRYYRDKDKDVYEAGEWDHSGKELSARCLTCGNPHWVVYNFKYYVAYEDPIVPYDFRTW